jgi:uncharacterized lipoprotein YajG
MHIRRIAVLPLCAILVQAGCMATPHSQVQSPAAASSRPAAASTPIPSRTRPAVNFNSAHPIPPQPGR